MQRRVQRSPTMLTTWSTCKACVVDLKETEFGPNWHWHHARHDYDMRSNEGVSPTICANTCAHLSDEPSTPGNTTTTSHETLSLTLSLRPTLARGWFDKRYMMLKTAVTICNGVMKPEHKTATEPKITESKSQSKRKRRYDKRKRGGYWTGSTRKRRALNHGALHCNKEGPRALARTETRTGGRRPALYRLYRPWL